MPCNDITDSLLIALDHNERINSYALTKRTCGAEVGDRELIVEYLRGRTVEEVLKIAPDVFLEQHSPTDETQEFLLLKHLFSVQSGLKSFVGQAPAGRNAPCMIDVVEYTPDGIELAASIRVEGITDEIRACSNCRCAAAREKRAARVQS